MPIATAVGAIVNGKRRLEGMTPALRTLFLDTGKIAANALKTKIRSEDDAAFKPSRAHRTRGADGLSSFP